MEPLARRRGDRRLLAETINPCGIALWETGRTDDTEAHCSATGATLPPRRALRCAAEHFERIGAVAEAGAVRLMAEGVDGAAEGGGG